MTKRTEKKEIGRTVSALWVGVSLALAAGAAFSAPPVYTPAERNAIRSLGREPVRQLQEDVDRYRQSEEVRQMIEKRREMEARDPVKVEPAEKKGFEFELKSIDHNDSEVLTKDEIAGAVAPFLGRRVGMPEVREMLGRINALYREKGYVVCEARLKPQRIRNGRLFVTLVEGKTGAVTVTGNDTTNEGYIRGAFDLEEGKVANYRDMSADLVHFNMTNDVVLTIDIRAGTEPGTTDYEITSHEPPLWTATVFADTTGSRSTGRPRAGASVTNRSVFGRRDAATLLGLASEGSKSVMFSYAIPLTSRGTRLSASASYGEVEVIQGPSAEGDVEGTSEYYSLRLDHPVYADSDMKWTVYGEWSRQKSSTDFFAVTIAETTIDTWRSGVEAIFLTDRSVFYATTGVGRADVDEHVFGEKWSQTILTGNAFWKVQATPSIALSLTGAWQSLLGGDALHTSQYFYLGHTSGVRGYENDVISAESGAYVNAQIDWAFAGPGTSLFGFLDAGKLGGETAYAKTGLASVGAGVTWPLWQGASLTGSVGVPLVRHLGEEMHVNKARFDLAVVATW